MAYEKQYEACQSNLLLLEGALEDMTEQTVSQNRAGIDQRGRISRN